LFLYWKDTNKPKKQQKYSLFDTFKDIKADKRLLYFLLAYWIYIDGVDTIIRMAVNFGITIGFSSNDLLIALLVTQFVSFPGTILINSIANYKTSEFSIMLCLVIYILITLIAYNLNTIFEFYLIAVLIGLAQGGIQALSRSYYARIIPKHRSSEYFGVYNMLGKFAALLGPLFVGFITYYTDDSRLGMLSIALFFIIGIYFFKKQCMLIKQE
jgi:UMF1 family MFS transporter